MFKHCILVNKMYYNTQSQYQPLHSEVLIIVETGKKYVK